MGKEDFIKALNQTTKAALNAKKKEQKDLEKLVVESIKYNKRINDGR